MMSLRPIKTELQEANLAYNAERIFKLSAGLISKAGVPNTFYVFKWGRLAEHSSIKREVVALTHLGTAAPSKLIDTGSYHNKEYLIKTYIPGKTFLTLNQRDKNFKSLAPFQEELETLVRQYHEKGVAGLDIKLSNTLFTHEKSVAFFDFSHVVLASQTEFWHNTCSRDYKHLFDMLHSKPTKIGFRVPGRDVYAQNCMEHELYR